MLILSKKKDFYDGVVNSTGIDKTIIYDRELIELEENNFPDLFKHKSIFSYKKDKSILSELEHLKIKKEYSKTYQHHNYFVVGFCGKLYVGWKIYTLIKKQYNDELITTITYDKNFINSILENKYSKSSIISIINQIQDYDCLQYFRDLKTPIFIFDNDFGRTNIDRFRNNQKFIVNPNLKEYEFYKIFDTFQAFQEIEMFLSGVLGSSEKEIIEVADKYKIQQYGFNKWSFRKEGKNSK